jgi:hypothetical protein
MYKAFNLSPMIPSYDVRATMAWFLEALGFSVVRDDQTYVILAKDTVMVHILRAGNDIGEMEFYLAVDDVDAIWATSGDKMPEARPPFDREYGMREVHVIVPHTRTLMFIGMMIAPQP